MSTLGEKRVVVNFNASGDSTVDSIKRTVAELIDLVDELPNANSQTGRWKAEAMTCLETGAMYAVKAATAGQDLSLDDDREEA